MSTNLEFWPAELTSNLPESPIQILQKAASELAVATNGGVEAGVSLDKTYPESSGIAYDFYLVSKPLNYRHLLFSVAFDPILLYPARLLKESDWDTVADSKQLSDEIKRIAASQETIKIIKALLAQSNSL